jgi:MoxR-like ATPase
VETRHRVLGRRYAQTEPDADPSGQVQPLIETMEGVRVRDDRDRHNLPSQLTSFVGRERELADVKRLLATGRMLTLVGAAGIGKTRLAVRAAAEFGAPATGTWVHRVGGG